MSEARRNDATTPRPRRTAGRRRRRNPLPLYAGLLLAVALAAAAVTYGCRALGRTAPASSHAVSPAAATNATPPAAVAGSNVPTPSAEPSPTPAAATTDTAVKDAALRYPDPPSVEATTITHAHPAGKLVAITLDDGIPFDTRILELFESRGVRCTTFLTGQAVKAHPDLVKRLAADGFEIANHTLDHKTLTKLSDSEIRSELESCQERISAITGNQAPYLRPPGGAKSKRVERVAAQLGFELVLWNRSFADTSRAATVDKIYSNVMDGLKPGDIILCHWGGKHNYEALKRILPEMERRGFTPVTVSELLAAEGAVR